MVPPLSGTHHAHLDTCKQVERRSLLFASGQTPQWQAWGAGWKPHPELVSPPSREGIGDVNSPSVTHLPALSASQALDSSVVTWTCYRAAPPRGAVG